MTQEQILEGNKLIAEFMGLSQGLPNETRWKKDWFEKEIGIRHSFLFYHSDWNWLMEVVEKIESFEYSVEIFKSASHNEPNKIFHRCVIEKMTNWNIELLSLSEEDDNTGKQYVKTDDKKLSTWTAVVEFIKWYNKNKEINE